MTKSQPQKKTNAAVVTPVSADKDESAIRLFELRSELPELEIPDRKKDLPQVRKGLVDD